MADVIVNQCFLGIVDCVLYRLELLSELKTRSSPSILPIILKMPFGASEPFDDLGMSLVLHVLFLSRWQDSQYPPRAIVENT
jgi:hypothetical protein